ncbi:MAG: hypothetical protein FJW29_02745 [Acidobacteria bacterium]|nr:hypothetical protein [Acidobacteriota bacterium]
MTPLDELKQLYYQASKATMTRDFARAIVLFKSLPDDEMRERAAVYMGGLAQMRSEWGVAGKGTRPTGRPAASGGAGRPRRSRA